MKIVMASDHAGCALRERLKGHLEARGHEIVDLGPASATDPVDYPDFAVRVARRVASGEVERGILVCGTGQGMAIAANKVRGVRAVAPYDATTTEMTRRHNDANVICFGERTQPHDLVETLADLWLETPFEGGRHARRVEKIARLESEAADAE